MYKILKKLPSKRMKNLFKTKKPTSSPTSNKFKTPKQMKTNPKTLLVVVPATTLEPKAKQEAIMKETP